MEGNRVFHHLVVISATLIVISAVSVNGQISTPCTPSMITSFTPCLNFITGSTGNGSSPTASCCSTLKSLMGTSMDCACLLIAANVPFQLPINRTLALSLPRACNMGGVPLQCKASGSPLPAPGPVPFLLSPTLPPTASSPLSPQPQASKAVVLAPAPAPAPDSEATLPLERASPPVKSKTPTANPGSRTVLNPSASNPSYSSFSLLLQITVAFMVFKSV